MSKAMTLVLLLLLVLSLFTTVLSEEVETLPATYSPTHIHMTLPSTGRRMLGFAGVFEEGVGATVEKHGEEIVKHAKDAVDVAQEVSSSYNPTSSYPLASYIITVIMVYVLYA
ncbi:hypothetical protein MtrunA17_Chr4g0031021 [Medicago truncatula]|uniref:Transmembrane protein, putative n=1 Tax=Medicago truncatula TaxID=3880 RepID=G7JTR5_MEDTR|nr:transmembrane protein, putative [Medicago truncatula]RHN60918.1 hypothetical protein MtrunA17_Chr4g0031021 [Medicago truncatula]